MKMILYISFVIFIICKTVAITSCFTINNADVFRNDGKEICKNGYCGSYSYKDLPKALRGLFHSMYELSMLDKVNNAAVATPLNRDELQAAPTVASKPLNADDGDVCCSTRIAHVNMTTMVNIYGENMTIYHFWYAPEPTTQYIPHASCVRTGGCPGACVLEYKTLVLLAYNANTSPRFDLFSVPGYCSCKNA